MSVITEWEDKLTEVMEKAAEKITSLGEERANLLSQKKNLKDEITTQEDANAEAKSVMQKLMDEITLQLKIKYELEHDISRIHSRKIIEEKDVARLKAEVEEIKADQADEIAKAKQMVTMDQNRREALLEKKKEELGKECLENDKLRIRLDEFRSEVSALSQELDMKTEKDKLMEKKSKNCSVALDNLFK